MPSQVAFANLKVHSFYVTSSSGVLLTIPKDALVYVSCDLTSVTQYEASIYYNSRVRIWGKTSSGAHGHFTCFVPAGAVIYYDRVYNSTIYLYVIELDNDMDNV